MENYPIIWTQLIYNFTSICNNRHALNFPTQHLFRCAMLLDQFLCVMNYGSLTNTVYWPRRGWGGGVWGRCASGELQTQCRVPYIKLDIDAFPWPLIAHHWHVLTASMVTHFAGCRLCGLSCWVNVATKFKWLIPWDTPSFRHTSFAVLYILMFISSLLFLWQHFLSEVIFFYLFYRFHNELWAILGKHTVSLLACFQRSVWHPLFGSSFGQLIHSQLLLINCCRTVSD